MIRPVRSPDTPPADRLGGTPPPPRKPPFDPQELGRDLRKTVLEAAARAGALGVSAEQSAAMLKRVRRPPGPKNT